MAKYRVVTTRETWANDYYEVEAKNKREARQKVLRGRVNPYDSKYLGGDPYAKPEIDEVTKL